jgi:two-component system nitrate/nitrite response regulator NarL
MVEDQAVDTNGIARQPGPIAPDAKCLRIAVVSEVRFLREGLAEFLERHPSVKVVALGADLAQAVAQSRALQPDIVMLDAAFPNGGEAVMRTRHVAPNVRVVVFAVKETEDDIVAWAELGVIGYVPSDASVTDLVRLVMDIHQGEQHCSGRVAAGLLRRIADRAREGNGHNATFQSPALTARERQTAELIGAGLSDKEIARRLNIGLATTKSHVHNLLRKLNARRRGEAVARLHEYAQHPG